jgi:hypothetical protein
MVHFAHCRPAKQWITTLLPCGSNLGLAPSSSLSQLKTKSLHWQLYKSGIVGKPVWSIRRSNGHEGLLTIGGIAFPPVKGTEMMPNQEHGTVIHKNLNRGLTGLPHSRNGISSSGSRSLGIEWEWHDLEAPSGWWQLLAHGIYVDNKKILHNQPIVLDVSATGHSYFFDLVNIPRSTCHSSLFHHHRLRASIPTSPALIVLLPLSIISLPILVSTRQTSKSPSPTPLPLLPRKSTKMPEAGDITSFTAIADRAPSPQTDVSALDESSKEVDTA